SDVCSSDLSNPAVASVDATGLVTSGANGTTTITVSSQGVPAVQISVTVKSLVSIAVSPTSVSLNSPGQVQVLTVTGLFSDGSQQDRKSTRLNSSHQIISYAVFCLKKKKKRQKRHVYLHRNKAH